jgi:hypothetical protein
VSRLADADPISLASLPHRGMVRRARDILRRIAAGEPYVRFHGKRLRHDRTRISVPLGRHYRLIFHDDGVRLRPVACMSHSAYNGTKPGTRRHH